MDKYVYKTDESPLVIIEVHGDLKVKGDDIEEVVINADSAEDLQVQQNGAEITVKCLSDCKIRTPREASLQISQAYGDTTLKAVEGEIKIDAVHGNLWLRSVGPVQIKSVHGNLEARNVMGALEVDRVDSNCTARDIQGALMVQYAGGNLTIDDVEEGIEARAEGNLMIRLDPNSGEDYSLRAGGNISWSMPEDASAEISVLKAGKILANLPGISGAQNAPFTFTLGEGDANVTLEAQGNVMINPKGSEFGFDFHFDTPEMDLGAEMPDPDLFADQITNQIDAQMAMLEQQLDSHMARISATLDSAGVSPEQAERIQRRAREASEQAAQRAQEKMRLAQERLERKMAAVQQRVEQRARQAEERARQAEQRAQRRERRGWSFGFTIPEPPHPPVPPRPPVPPTPPSFDDKVTDDERLTVLRMLQQKKISLDEAEKLLAALEGKES